MESLENYSKIIQNIIAYYAAIPYSVGEFARIPVFDIENNHYLLVVHGRENKKNIHYTLIHVDIIEGKFWIRYDGTEDGVATDLLEVGIPKDRIVLAFYSENKRQYTEFAVG